MTTICKSRSLTDLLIVNSTFVPVNDNINRNIQTPTMDIVRKSPSIIYLEKIKRRTSRNISPMEKVLRPNITNSPTVFLPEFDFKEDNKTNNKKNTKILGQLAIQEFMNMMIKE